jgi:CxxC-x17-CxxC domain-containing protein
MGKNSTKAEKAQRNREYAQAHKKKASRPMRPARPAFSPAPRPEGTVGSVGERTMYPAVCSSCGVQTTVPFEPTGGRPVLCRTCFQAAPRS